VTGRYETGPWTLRLTIPYLHIDGGTAPIPGIGVVPNLNPAGRGRGAAPGGGDLAQASASGLGDLVAAATYNLYPGGASGVGVDLTGRIKFATADEDEGLGTGANDYSVQVDVFKDYGAVTLFAGLGYTDYGSTSFISLDNAFNVNVGGSYRIDDRNSAGLSFDARERLSQSDSPLREFTAFWNYRIDRYWRAQAYVLKGFADGSPDYGVGGSVAYAF